jgi:hypothetical protein
MSNKDYSLSVWSVAKKNMVQNNLQAVDDIINQEEQQKKVRKVLQSKI